MSLHTESDSEADPPRGPDPEPDAGIDETAAVEAEPEPGNPEPAEPDHVSPDEAAGEIGGTDAPHRCLDCDSPLDGKYCSQCGQRDVDRKVPLGDLMSDLVDEFTGLQARFLLTIRSLVARPGFLTNEFVEGRRVRYLGPVRLYLILALGFFFLVTSFDPIDAETSAETIASPEFAIQLRESGLPREIFIKKFLDRENSSLPTILLIVMIPSLAMVLKLLYLRSHINYVQHLVFSFHFFSIVLIALAPGAAMAWLPEPSMILYYIGFIAFYVWLLIAMRTAYHQDWLKTSIKFAIMAFAFLVLLAICFWTAEMWAMYNA